MDLLIDKILLTKKAQLNFKKSIVTFLFRKRLSKLRIKIILNALYPQLKILKVNKNHTNMRKGIVVYVKFLGNLETSFNWING